MHGARRDSTTGTHHRASVHTCPCAHHTYTTDWRHGTVRSSPRNRVRASCQLHVPAAFTSDETTPGKHAVSPKQHTERLELPTDSRMHRVLVLTWTSLCTQHRVCEWLTLRYNYLILSVSIIDITGIDIYRRSLINRAFRSSLSVTPFPWLSTVEMLNADNKL